MDIETQKSARLNAIRRALLHHSGAALLSANSMNVLLMSGYWPVTGMAVAIVTAEPQLILLVPEDEQELARDGWADQIYTYQSSSLSSLQTSLEQMQQHLKQLLPTLGLNTGRIFCGEKAAQIVASYVALADFDSALKAIVRESLPNSTVEPADQLLAQLRVRPTQWERERISLACQIASRAYEEGISRLKVGITERVAASAFLNELMSGMASITSVMRANGFFYCMSGPDAAHAWVAYQRSGNACLCAGQTILVHCNSYVNGYWTDLTRTYVLGKPDTKLMHMFDAVVAAREAAFGLIRPGVPASQVDHAARSILTKRGFGSAFKHATGHGVGFSPIDPHEKPRIHPQSIDILEEGMVFNIEPGIYIEGYGGLRDCNMVTVTRDGCELLSRFQLQKEDLFIAI